jgi:hypothetical protein
VGLITFIPVKSMRHVTRSRKSQLYLREPLGEQTVAVDLNKLPVRVPAGRTGSSSL